MRVSSCRTARLTYENPPASNPAGGILRCRDGCRHGSLTIGAGSHVLGERLAVHVPAAPWTSTDKDLGTRRVLVQDELIGEVVDHALHEVLLERLTQELLRLEP